MYHYTESGLKNVWLVNGYRVKRTPYGEGVAIDNLEGLHRAIAREIVRRPGRLTGPEFRFLRLALELSQETLARYAGADVQAVARWEKGKARVPGPADRLLRALYRETIEGTPGIVDLVKRLQAEGMKEPARRQFRRTARGWQPTEKAA